MKEPLRSGGHVEIITPDLEAYECRCGQPDCKGDSVELVCQGCRGRAFHAIYLKVDRVMVFECDECKLIMGGVRVANTAVH